MIIDDDPDEIEFFCEALSEIDGTFECISARGGEEAMMILRDLNAEKFPSYIFMDLNMPRMDGKECLSLLKSDVSLSSIPVIIYTTSNTQSEIDETRKLGAKYFLTKPNGFADLKSAIKQILDLDTGTMKTQ